MTKSCFPSAAHEEIVATEVLREVSVIGKEMIDGNRAVSSVRSRVCAHSCADIMQAQLNIEGQKYLTSSMVIPIIEELRESLRSTRMHCTTIDAPRGVKILEDIIEDFDQPFGDGTHITKFREDHDHGRQSCGHTQVRCVRFVFGVLVCHGNFGLRVSLKKL